VLELEIGGALWLRNDALREDFAELYTD